MTIPGDILSGLGQFASLALAALIGRYLLKSRPLIWMVALLGAFGAMWAHILYDGQGAIAEFIYVPVIYYIAVAGRKDIGGRRRM
ncbi:MAG: hypothetical protein QM770_21740 [Tepidisphaeraceae bacterium]